MKKRNVKDYKKCLFSGSKQYRKMKEIRSYKHHIFTEEVNKIAISGDDDKRYMLSDRIHTLAYGHIGQETIRIYPRETIRIYPRETIRIYPRV